MMENALDTLIYTIQHGQLLYKRARLLFLTARNHNGLNDFNNYKITLQQHFKPYENDLINSGFDVTSNIPTENKSYDAVILLLPKNIIEAKYMMANATLLLSDGGMLICSADNKSGGSRIKKLMQGFGFQDISQESRNKAKVAWAIKTNPDNKAINKAIENGSIQTVINNKFLSQAGIFGWNKIDIGSEILTRFLPDDLNGVGADFGCGYGYLSEFTLSKNKKIKTMYCIDADHRAIDCCKQNLTSYTCDKKFLWSDLTNSQTDINNLDFIIMNPPFHDGKNTDINIGVSFINTAHNSLAKNGKLYMVANKQLPYEDTLAKLFKQSNKLYEGQGFKVFEAVK